MRMTDEQLIDYLGVKGEERAQSFIDGLPPEKRAVFDRMADLEVELKLWHDGLGPKPNGVLIDTERSTKRRKAWR